MARLRAKNHIRQFNASQAATHWDNLRGQVQIQKVHLEEETKGAPVRRWFERLRLRMTRFQEFWRWGIWAVGKGNNDEFLKAAIESFKKEGLTISAILLSRLYRSRIAHTTFANAIQFYRQVTA